MTSLKSCIYEGKVTHCRHRPMHHRFQYRLFMVYLDLSELETIVGPRRLISSRKFSGRSFLRSDHGFDSSLSIEAEVRSKISSETGVATAGPIRLLTQLRYCGYFLSPLNLYYLMDDSGVRVEHVVAEVNNTPWDERHWYVLSNHNRLGDASALRFEHPKSFHVSPFMGMEMRYRWSLSEPDERVNVHVANIQEADPFFDVSMTLERRNLDKKQLRQMTWRYALMTARIGTAIYFQALKLWWKRCPFYTHPKNLTQANPSTLPTSSDKIVEPSKREAIH